MKGLILFTTLAENTSVENFTIFVRLYMFFLIYHTVKYIYKGYNEGTIPTQLKKLDEDYKTLTTPGRKNMNRLSYKVKMNEYELEGNNIYWLGFWLLLLLNILKL